jgi:esterase
MKYGLMEKLRSSAYEKTIQDYYRPIAGRNRSVVERIMADLKAAPRQTVIGTMEALGTFDPTPALRAYRGARLSLVTPPNDNPAGYYRLDVSLPHRVVEGTGHWLHLDDPAAFNAKLDEFLAAIDQDEGQARSIKR